MNCRSHVDGVQTHLIILIVLVVVNLLNQEAGCQTQENCVLIYGEPQCDSIANYPFPFHIFAIDLNSQRAELRDLWSAPVGTMTNQLRLYPDQGLLIVELQGEQGVELLSMYLTSETLDVSPIYHGSTRPLYLKLRTKSGGGELLDVINLQPNSERSYKVTAINLQDKSSTVTSELSIDPSAVLSGSASAFNIAGADVENVRLTGDGSWEKGGGIQTVSLPRLKGIEVSSEAPRNWNVILSDTAWSIIIPVAWDQSEGSREVLILRKRDSSWSSTYVPGAETRLRGSSHWLYGTIAHSDPRTVHALHLAYPSLISDSVAVVDLYSSTTHVFQLGTDVEVLWIGDSGLIVYRVGDRLMKAHLSGGHLDQSVEVLKDTRAKHIHWAFLNQ